LKIRKLNIDVKKRKWALTNICLFWHDVGRLSCSAGNKRSDKPVLWHNSAFRENELLATAKNGAILTVWSGGLGTLDASGRLPSALGCRELECGHLVDRLI